MPLINFTKLKKIFTISRKDKKCPPLLTVSTVKFFSLSPCRLYLLSYQLSSTLGRVNIQTFNKIKKSIIHREKPESFRGDLIESQCKLEVRRQILFVRNLQEVLRSEQAKLGVMLRQGSVRECKVFHHIFDLNHFYSEKYFPLAFFKVIFMPGKIF